VEKGIADPVGALTDGLRATAGLAAGLVVRLVGSGKWAVGSEGEG